MFESEPQTTQRIPEIEVQSAPAEKKSNFDARAAFHKGKASGIDLVTARTVHGRASRVAQQGLLVAEGDSWFDCPGGDLLSALEDQGFEVDANAHGGDTLEDMSFNPRQLGDLHRLLNRVKLSGRTPRAILLCGGGNDIAGEEFGVFLNHTASGLPALNTTVVDGVIDGRLKVALSHWVGTVDAVARGVFGLPLKIVIHGYDYPVPDGRGATFAPFRPQGPCLRSGFWHKGHTNLQRNRGVIRDVINRLNDMQMSLVEELELPNLVHVDLRNTLSSVLYENDWESELQPTEAGFRSLARKIAAAI